MAVQSKFARYEQLLHEAHVAGLAAGEAAVPVPMIVGDAKNLFSNEFATGAKLHYEANGVCGFAWIHLGRGNSSFARWAVKNGHGSKSYYGGVDIRVRAHGQSYERKVAHADAFVAVLKADPLLADERIYVESRLD